jgi:hypothetical protein
VKKVPATKVVTTPQATESPLPPRIQAALGELVGAAREGLLALSVGVGLGVVHELMELEVNEVVGPKGKHNPSEACSVTLCCSRRSRSGPPGELPDGEGEHEK